MSTPSEPARRTPARPSPALTRVVPPATDRAVWDPVILDAATLDGLRERAEADLVSPWPVPLASGYARYFADGDRDRYEQVVFARQARLSRATVLAAATLEPAWLDEVIDGTVLLCEQSSWCWPAHDDTFTRHGAVLPTVTDPFLDLGAGEVAAQLAWIDHLLGPLLDDRVPGLRSRIRHEVDRRVLAPFERRRDWHWLGLTGDVHNWNPWIHGNVLVAALSLVDDPARRARLVGLVTEGLERYAASLPEDGAIDEGYSYWWNGACRLIEAYDLLDWAAGHVPAEHAGRLRETVAFPHRVHLGGAWYLNHADGPAKPSPDQPWHVLYRAARRSGDRAAEAHAAAQRRPGEPVAHESQGLGRLLRALTDPDWTALPGGTADEGWLHRESWFPSTQVLVARSQAGSSGGLTLAVKGGHNDEHHNHNDVGSFVVALNGVPVLVDPGRPTYTAQTFGAGRYEIWTMRSGWHNLPEIRGHEQGAGRDRAASYVATEAREAYAEMSVELANAYPEAGVRSWRRTARLERAADTVTIRDEWDLQRGGPGTRVHLIVAGDVRLGPEGAEVTALEGAGAAQIAWSPPVPATMTVRDLDDPWLTGVWGDRLTRVEIDVSGLGPIGTLDLIVKEHR
ncbi:heparinase II/III family protein [Actinoplanes sp. NPDC051851]|uniref:heparinase II/III domain-containing protein n=1 Tax=Actinoplanes sp. NPDC051851 TaxID=3154753 RepID=UPI00344791CB